LCDQGVGNVAAHVYRPYDHEGRARACPAHHLHSAAQQLHESLADRQPKPCAARVVRVCYIDLAKLFKDERNLIFVNAYPCVCDLDAPHIACVTRRTDRDGPALWSELDGIRSEIRYHLRHL